MGIMTFKRADRKKSPFGVRWSERGKRKFRFFGSAKDRDAYAKDLQKAVDVQGRVILSLSAADASVMAECIKLAGSSGAVLRAVHEVCGRALLGSISLAAARQEYIDERTNAGRDEKYVKKLEDILGKLDFVSPQRVSDADARRWASALPLSPVSVHGHIKVCRTFWGWLVERKYAAENVFAKVPMPQVVEKEPGFLTVEQTRALLKAARDHFPDAVAYFALGAFAGLRSSAICRLEWKEHIRFEQRGILITGENAKNKRRQFVDGHEPNLWAWLEWAREHAPGGFDLEPRAWERRRGQVAEKAEVVMPHNALRHSFCTHHCALYGDAGRTATLLTHRGNVAILYQHYKGNAGRGDAERYFGIRP
jgi:site-specific recombinase XerD